MPLYDYACQKCGHIVEVIHGVHDSGPSSCPRCQGSMRKLLASPAIVFKGSGWAKKDARDASRSRVASGSSGASSDVTDKPTSTESTKTDGSSVANAKSTNKESAGPASAAEG